MKYRTPYFEFPVPKFFRKIDRPKQYHHPHPPRFGLFVVVQPYNNLKKTPPPLPPPTHPPPKKCSLKNPPG